MTTKQHTVWILATTAIGGFMSVLDSSIVAMILPNLSRYFHTSLGAIEWVTMAYLLVISGLVLAWGRLGDIFGHKKIYLLGYIIFTIGSLLCGLASSVWVLIIFRMIQAIGAGMLMAVSPAIITAAVSSESRGKALSLSAVTMGVATIVGPVMGGFLTTAFGWRSVFMVNIPIGMIGLWLAQRNIPTENKHTHQTFDFGGASLLVIALVAVLLPLSLVEKLGWANPWLWFSVGMGLILMVGFAIFEKRVGDPLLDIKLFDNRLFSMSNIAAFFNFMAQFTIILLIPFYLQDLRGLSASQAGMFFLPMPIMIILIAPLSGSLSDRMDSRYMSSVGMAIMACGMWQLSNLKADSAYIFLILGLATIGLGSGLFQTPNNSAVMGSVLATKRGVASGVLATMRNMGMVLGVAISGAIFSSSRHWLIGTLKARGFQNMDVTKVAFAEALHITYLVGAGFALTAAAVSLVKGSTRSGGC
jgi:EmrB/QacA subfamily drug resistance transporter